MSKAVLDYIESHWDGVIKECREDKEDGTRTLYRLPYPFTIPAVGTFEELYYWDTYFTNPGLMIVGKEQLAKNNTDNVLFMIDRFGHMKNSNRFYHSGLGQPPFASKMVRETFDYYKDKTWLYGAYNTLKKEYNFWMTERMTEIGLNQYAGKNVDKSVEDKADDFIRRACNGQIPEGKTLEQIVDHYMICCESGWDCNPRWGFEGYNYVQVELNSLLYDWEKNMAYFSEVLGMGEEQKWEKAAADRKALMYKYMLNEDGILIDYNFVEKKHSKVFSSCSLYPLFVNMVEEDIAKKSLELMKSKLETDYGLASCEKNEFSDTHTFQWNYPIAWACQQHLAVKALDNYGFKEDAARVAAKYKKMVEKVYAETGQLWEKYNVVEGSNQVLSKERTASMPPMMGWTAAAYLTCKRYIEEGVIG